MNPLTASSVYLTTGSDNFSLWSHAKFGGMSVRAVRDV